MIPTTGWPRTGSGTKSSGGAEMKAAAALTSSGASAMKSRNSLRTSVPRSAGCINMPP
jgi:hypothetical protein